MGIQKVDFDNIKISDDQNGVNEIMIGFGSFGHVNAGKTELSIRLRNHIIELCAKLNPGLKKLTRQDYDHEQKKALGAKADSGTNTISGKQYGLTLNINGSIVKIVGIDNPGHADYMSTAIKKSSLLNSAGIVVNVTSGIEKQTENHIRFLISSGIKNFIIIINKCDDPSAEENIELVGFEVFQFLNTVFQEYGVKPLISKLGDIESIYSSDDRYNVSFIFASAISEEPRFVEKINHLIKTIYAYALDSAEKKKKEIAQSPFAVIVEGSAFGGKGVGQVITGRCLSGNLEANELSKPLQYIPVKNKKPFTFEVRSLQSFNLPIERIIETSSISIRTNTEIEKPERGDIITTVKDSKNSLIPFITSANRFIAEVFIDPAYTRVLKKNVNITIFWYTASSSAVVISTRDLENKELKAAMSSQKCLIEFVFANTNHYPLIKGWGFTIKDDKFICGHGTFLEFLPTIAIDLKSKKSQQKNPIPAAAA